MIDLIAIEFMDIWNKSIMDGASNEAWSYNIFCKESWYDSLVWLASMQKQRPGTKVQPRGK